jgi:pyruvate dehydrogenase E2 component (dihydrolipoamide acetyltransferase)
MEGAAFTVSHIAARGVTRFVALPHRFQSAILAVASGGEAVRLHDGQAVSASVATLTLSYDHVVCDGVYAADFLTRLIQEMEKAEL